MIKLFDVEEGVVKLTEHCSLLTWLDVIKTEFPDNYMDAYAYIFYMSCPNESNPFFNRPEDEKEEQILSSLKSKLNTENLSLSNAVYKAKELYETPTLRAYLSLKIMLDNVSDYVSTAQVTAGRDGNINSLLSIAKSFDDIRRNFKSLAADLENEQQTTVRGGQSLGYDQR